MVIFNQGFLKILDDINGIALPGQITAIMGPSGSGKTSLLNVLSCRQEIPKNSAYTKKVFANNVQLNSQNFGKIAAYVMQDDILLPAMTPFECLTFAASLRLTCNQEERNKRVDYLIQDLRLEKCANTPIGSIIERGVSGGEKKRTAIGVEIITDPPLIFLDEPTSGLDSFTAFTVVNVLKNLCQRKNKTVISTIHLPSSDIYNLFDRLILLIKGKEIFQDNANAIYEYAQRINKPIPEYTNPSDHMMKIMYRNEPPEPGEEESHEQLKLIYQQEFRPKVQRLIDSSKYEDIDVKEISLSRTAPFFVSFGQLLYRAGINLKRNVFYTYARFILAIYMSIIIMMVFPNLQEISYVVVRNKCGAIFFVIMSTFMSAMQNVLLTFPDERALFLREQSNKMYGVLSYYITKTLVEIPFQILMPVVMTLLVYWVVGFRNEPDAFFSFLACLIVLTFTSNSMGLTLGCMFPDIKIAMAITPLIQLPIMLYCGFYANETTIVSWLQWVQYISPLRYCLEIIMAKDFVRSDFTKQTYGPLQLEYPLDSYNFNVGYSLSFVILTLIGIFVRVIGFFFLKLQAYLHTHKE